MLSCNFALRKSCSGPVGGPRASAAFKVGGQRGRQCSSSAKASKNVASFLSQPASEGAENKVASASQLDTHSRPASSFVYAQQRLGSAIGTRSTTARSSGASSSNACGDAPHLATLEETPSCLGTSRSQPSLTQPKPFDSVLNKLKSERIDIHRDLCELRQRGSSCGQQSTRLSSAQSMTSGMSYCSQRSRLLSSAGSMASGMSSCPSQAMRSSVLDMELEVERDRRIAAEAELASLKARLTSNAPYASC